MSNHYTPAQIKNCLKSISAIKIATMKILLQMEAIIDVPTTKSTLFMVIKKWDTKEGIGKLMKNALYVQRYGRWQLSG